MGLSFEFSPVWWMVISIIYVPYVLLLVSRRSYKKPAELKIQLLVAFASLLLSILVELVAVTAGLWNYTPRNWPIILWFGYFGSGLLAYQLVKAIEERSR